MRRVERGPAPTGASWGTKSAKELTAATAHYGDVTKTGSYPFAIYKADPVKTALDQKFFGKCAYCETVYASSAPVDIEHFRPKGAVEGDAAHRGYWWLAMAWANLLPSCIDCNRRRNQPTPVPSPSLVELDAGAKRFSASRVMLSGKKDAFPIAGTRARLATDSLAAEEALLINPCEEDPARSISFHVGSSPLIGLVLPVASGAAAAIPVAEPGAGAVATAAAASGLNIRGAVSIQVYGLNRLGLVQERTRVLRRLEFLGSMVIEIASIAGNLEDYPDEKVQLAVDRLNRLQDLVVAQLLRATEPDEPYSRMAHEWLVQFKAKFV